MKGSDRQIAKVLANYSFRGRRSWKGSIVERCRPGTSFHRSTRLIEIYHKRLNLPHIFV